MTFRAWLRESRWSLVAVAVLVPIAIAIVYFDRWQPYLEANRRDHTVVSAGAPAQFNGAVFTLTEARVVDGAEAGVSEGRDVVIATWRVEIEEPPQFTGCETAVVGVVDGIEREWEAEAYMSLDLEFDDDVEEICRLAEPGRFDLLQTYLVPSGVVVDPMLELSAIGGSSVLRFTE